MLTSFHPGQYPHPPRHVPLAGEADLLLDGVQDAPHVLIYLQALKQSSFTGKKRGGLGLRSCTPESRGRAHPSPLCQRASTSAILREAETGGGWPVTAGHKRIAHSPLALGSSAGLGSLFGF